ncbi:hypothetical protein DAPPUDRAFT_121226, partial [Daphnia pulex]
MMSEIKDLLTELVLLQYMDKLKDLKPQLETLKSADPETITAVEGKKYLDKSTPEFKEALAQLLKITDKKQKDNKDYIVLYRPAADLEYEACKDDKSYNTIKLDSNRGMKTKWYASRKAADTNRIKKNPLMQSYIPADKISGFEAFGSGENSNFQLTFDDKWIDVIEVVVEPGSYEIYTDSLGRYTIYHASKHSLHFLSYERFLQHAKTIEEVEFNVSSEQKKIILNYCMDMAGSSYGWLTLFGIALKALMCRFGIKINNPFQDSATSGICSEVGYEILQILGCREELNPENITLKPLYNLIKKFHAEQEDLTKGQKGDIRSQPSRPLGKSEYDEDGDTPTPRSYSGTVFRYQNKHGQGPFHIHSQWADKDKKGGRDAATQAIIDAEFDGDEESAYDSHRESLSDAESSHYHDLVRERYRDNALDHEDNIPRDLLDHPGFQPHLDRMNEEANNALEAKRRSEDEAANKLNDSRIPNRESSHEYAPGQRQAEMLKDVADASGGSVDIGTMHKLYPNQKDTWKGIFGKRAKMTSDEIQAHINNMPKQQWDISYGKWDSSMQNLNSQDQTVFRLDHSDDSMGKIEASGLKPIFNKISNLSRSSGHPTNARTIGWARVDTTNPKHWIIDETQTDYSKAVRKFLNENNKDEEADGVDKLVEFQKPWHEALINHIIKTAKQHGVEHISTHTPESKTAHTGADNVHSVYKDAYGVMPNYGFHK